MASRRSKKVKSPPKKRYEDELSPPKKHHFSVKELACKDPNDPHGDLYWNSPTSKSSSQFLTLALAENAVEHRKKLMERKRELQIFIQSGGKSRDSSPSRKDMKGSSRSRSSSPKKGPDMERKKKPEAKPHYIGAFPSSQPKMTEEEEKLYYDKLYPFNYLTLKEFETTATSIERVYQIEELTGKKSEEGKSRTMEAVVLYCRYLEDQAHVALTSAVFVDCMGYGGETCLYASAFHFQRIISIELTERSRYLANRGIRSIEGLSRSCTILYGTVRDYFPYDADVYYYDLLWVSEARSWVDEAVLIDQIFTLCAKVQTPVAYLALMTVTNNIKADKDYQAPHMKLVMSTKIHYGEPDECTIWLFQILHMKVEHMATSVTMALHKEMSDINEGYAPHIK